MNDVFRLVAASLKSAKVGLNEAGVPLAAQVSNLNETLDLLHNRAKIDLNFNPHIHLRRKTTV